MNSSKRKVLFINPNWENLSLICSYISHDYYVIGFGPSPAFYSLSLESYHPIYGNINDYQSIFDISNLYDVESIVSDNCDYSLLVSETMSNLMRKPSLGINAAQLSNSKLRQRILAEKAGIKQPMYSYCNSEEDINRFIKLVGKPVLVKPSDSRGSMGITYLKTSSTSHEIVKSICYCLSASPSGSCLVEEFIDGDLYTIDGFLLDNSLSLVGVASRERTGEGRTLTREIFYKSSVDKVFLEKCYSFLLDIATAFIYTNGHIHCEALLASNGDLYLVECTNRGAGVFTSSTINPYVSECDINSMFIALKSANNCFINRTQISTNLANKRDASLLFPSLGSNGELLERFDLDSVKSMSLVLDAYLFAKIGRPLPTSVDGPSRHIAIALKTSDKREVDNLMNEIKSKYVSVL